jgi:hypothetical protein
MVNPTGRSPQNYGNEPVGPKKAGQSGQVARGKAPAGPDVNAILTAAMQSLLDLRDTLENGQISDQEKLEALDRFKERLNPHLPPSGDE